ncbi:hypothetical protein JNB63_08070 [Microbacterium trichothecenolyticum]|uniref:Uncharacterized protein n=1 Tax=Microbacterium ureisolvens TaxID=2781186 RepID=A0ABS7HXS5_9MICO|nr:MULTISPECIES: hypothetical protein [Microbacterium]MBW9109305.1 hypothetical protein [Microbacterium ureisolvens]MBW9120045.1 hypothetical protein [Microbacterium trichothecenolyticum]
MTRNPWAVSLWVAGALSLAVAFMLTVVTWQLTDYETYDVAGVASIEAWARLLVVVAAVTFTGAVTLAGIERLVGHGVGVGHAEVRADVEGPTR